MLSRDIESKAAENDLIILGKISGYHGVKGWVKVFSDTSPRENIVKYSPWYLYQKGEWKQYKVTNGKRHSKTIIASLEGFTQREHVADLLNTVIAVKRNQLPEAVEGEYYWSDLTGMQVVNKDDVELGAVSYLFETGANDVMVVKKGKKEHFIPFIQPQYICSIDIEKKLITVDWDADF